MPLPPADIGLRDGSSASISAPCGQSAPQPGKEGQASAANLALTSPPRAICAVDARRASAATSLTHNGVSLRTAGGADVVSRSHQSNANSAKPPPRLASITPGVGMPPPDAEN